MLFCCNERNTWNGIWIHHIGDITNIFQYIEAKDVSIDTDDLDTELFITVHCCSSFKHNIVLFKFE